MHGVEFELPDYSQTRLHSFLNDGPAHLTLASPATSAPLSGNLPLYSSETDSIEIYIHCGEANENAF